MSWESICTPHSEAQPWKRRKNSRRTKAGGVWYGLLQGIFSGLGRPPGVGNGNPLQYSCQENPMDRGAWWLWSVRSQRVRHDRVRTWPHSGSSSWSQEHLHSLQNHPEMMRLQGYMVLTASRNSSLTYLIQRLPGLSCTPVVTGNSLPTSVDSQPMAHIEWPARNNPIYAVMGRTRWGVEIPGHKVRVTVCKLSPPEFCFLSCEDCCSGSFSH